MAWQAVNRMHYSQAGGGGPQGRRPGRPAAAGFGVLTALELGSASQPDAARRPSTPPSATPWRSGRSTRVVVSTDPAAPFLQRGSDPVYAAAFMTAALGRLPRVEAGAWVWNDVEADTTPPSRTGRDALGACTRKAEGHAGRRGGHAGSPALCGSRGPGGTVTPR